MAVVAAVAAEERVVAVVVVVVVVVVVILGIDSARSSVLTDIQHAQYGKLRKQKHLCRAQACGSGFGVCFRPMVPERTRFSQKPGSPTAQNQDPNNALPDIPCANPPSSPYSTLIKPFYINAPLPKTAALDQSPRARCPWRMREGWYPLLSSWAFSSPVASPALQAALK